jgi:ankyrin repeat protein
MNRLRNMYYLLVVFLMTPQLYAAELRLANPVLHAAVYGDLAALTRLLSEGADVNTSVNGWTPLIEASMMGHAHIVQELLKHHNIDVNLKLNTAANHTYTPLELAVIYGNFDVVGLLVNDPRVSRHIDGSRTLLDIAKSGRNSAQIGSHAEKVQKYDEIIRILQTAGVN